MDVYDVVSYLLSILSGLLNIIILVQLFNSNKVIYFVTSIMIYSISIIAVPFIIKNRKKENIEKLKEHEFISKLIEWRHNKKIDHFWVIIYDLLVTGPHLLLQIFYVKFESLQILYIAITIATLSLAMKCILFAFGYHKLTYFFIWLCFFTDIMGLISSLSLIDFSLLNTSFLTTFWFYKLLIGTLPMTFAGSWMLCIGIALEIYDYMKSFLNIHRILSFIAATITFIMVLLICMIIIGIGLELGALSYVALLLHIYNYSRFGAIESQIWTQLIEWISCIPNSIKNEKNINKYLNEYERMEFNSFNEKIICRVNIANHICSEYTTDYAVCIASNEMVKEYNKTMINIKGIMNERKYNPFYECNSFNMIRYKARHDTKFDAYDLNVMWRMRNLYFKRFEIGFGFADKTMYSSNKFERYCIGYSFMGCTIFAIFVTVPLYLFSRFITLFYPLIAFIYSFNTFNYFQSIYSMFYTVLVLIIIFLFIKYIYFMEYCLYHIGCLELEVKLKGLPNIYHNIMDDMEYQYNQILGKHARDLIIYEIFGNNLGILIISYCRNTHDQDTIEIVEANHIESRSFAHSPNS